MGLCSPASRGEVSPAFTPKLPASALLAVPSAGLNLASVTQGAKRKGKNGHRVKWREEMHAALAYDALLYKRCGHFEDTNVSLLVLCLSTACTCSLLQPPQSKAGQGSLLMKATVAVP